MHSGRNFRVGEIIYWTRREMFIFLALSAAVTALYSQLGWIWLAIPWVPVALIGTAVAFVTGFKNNASYGRLWEARKIWGEIVNTSRFWATQVFDYPDAERAAAAGLDLETTRRQLVYRHFAFLTALRYQLRQRRAWESMDRQHNIEYLRRYAVAEWQGDLAGELEPLLEPAEFETVMAATNRAMRILALQSRQLGSLARQGLVNDLEHMFMSQTIKKFIDLQGQCERIKNFPYPRQFATLNLLFIWLFIVLVPFGLVEKFGGLGGHLVWLNIPATMVVSWVFHTMERIGEASENPFEGGACDVPITQLSRAIEIDLRELLGEKELPPPVEPVNSILT
ncbi:MAG: bestrophin family ion channel [Myxococcota bacterium]|nr:bestrophin family ion channel [Myxococcota bacterium]